MKLTFHHLGVACHDLESDSRMYAALGYATETPDFVDHLQGVRGRFLVGPGPRLELICDLEGATTVAGFLARGTKIYHHGYFASDLEEAISNLRKSRGKVVRGPTPAVAFGGRHIAFLTFASGELVELISEV